MILHVLLHSALLRAQGHDRSDVLLRHENDRFDDRLANLVDFRGIRHFRRVLDARDRPVAQLNLVDDGGSSGHERHVVLALEAFLHDIHVQQAQEPAAESEAERLGGFRLVVQRRIVELQLLQRVAQRFILARLDRIEPGEHLRFDLLEARQRRGRRTIHEGNRVADARVLELPHSGRDESHLSSRKLLAAL